MVGTTQRVLKVITGSVNDSDDRVDFYPGVVFKVLSVDFAGLRNFKMYLVSAGEGKRRYLMSNLEMKSRVEEVPAGTTSKVKARVTKFREDD